jgi:hypothetical protein
MRRVIGLVIAIAAACGDDAADDDGIDVPGLVLPDIIPLPYVVAGMGGTSLDVTVENPGNADTGVTWQLAGDADITITNAPSVVPAGGTATITIAWIGADAPRITGATLMAASDAGARAAEVWAVAGNPALPPADFAPVAATGRAGAAEPPVIGESAVVVMPTAPFPAPGRTWTDARVHIFVPESYRQRDAHDVVLHFHGHNTTIDATVPAHRYREQLYASGANAILVIPQGPVNAASGDFGKLSDPAGTAAFFDEVLTVLYRAGKITRPVLGDVVLTSHSGGYAAVAANLADTATFAVGQVDLFDSLYGYLTTYRDFVLAGHRLRSNYTSGGGTDTNNMMLATTLTMMGADVATTSSIDTLRDHRAVIYFTPSDHNGSTREDAAYSEQLRWSPLPGRRGPRAEIRTLVSDVVGGDRRVNVTWRAPIDADVTGWVVQASSDGVAWTGMTQASRNAIAVSFPAVLPMRVRIVPLVAGLSDDAGLPSDAYAVAPDADILVVDGFDRVVDGSWSGLAHELAARIGAAAGAVHTVTNEAITEDAFSLSRYRVVIWLVGDESTDDHTFTAAERAAIDAYLAGGGHLIVSGSEIGYELGPTTAGAQWLATTFGAAYAADDAGTNNAGTFSFGTAAAPYAEDFPDTFTTTGSGTIILRYATNTAAAVGIPGRAAIIGFPLETIEDPSALATTLATLIDFVD